MSENCSYCGNTVCICDDKIQPQPSEPVPTTEIGSIIVERCFNKDCDYEKSWTYSGDCKCPKCDSMINHFSLPTSEQIQQTVDTLLSQVEERTRLAVDSELKLQESLNESIKQQKEITTLTQRIAELEIEKKKIRQTANEYYDKWLEQKASNEKLEAEIKESIIWLDYTRRFHLDDKEWLDELNDFIDEQIKKFPKIKLLTSLQEPKNESES